MKKLLATDASWVSLVQRLVLAVVFFPHGMQKLLGWFGGHGVDATMKMFEQGMHIPAVFAMLAILAESIGSIGLALGLLTRVAALGISSVMVVAVAIVHSKIGFFMNWAGTQHGEGFEYHLLVLALAIPLIIKGGGLWSLDALLARGEHVRRWFAPRPRVGHPA
jgi:putative oxidoreductase